jgi:hypothetical protein
MKVARSQKGMSMLSWMLVLTLVAFFASAAFKLLPHYFDFMSMEKIITSVETEATGDVRSVNAFMAHVGRGMEVNNIRDLPLKDVLDVRMENNEFRVHLKYERREPLIRNIDLVVRFDKEFRVRMP